MKPFKMKIGSKKWTRINWDEAMLAAARKGLWEAALVVEGQAVRLCPVGVYPKKSGRVGGRLRGSLTHAIRGKRSYVSGVAEGGDEVSEPNTEFIAHVGTNVEYAPYVEYGTYKMDAQPYLQPAMDLTHKEAAELYAQAIREELKKRGQ